MFATAAVLAGGRQLFGASQQVAALAPAISESGRAAERAVRSNFVGKLTFPVDADPAYGSLVCLNNFGGRSNAHGACGHAGVDIGNDTISGRGRPLLACVDGFVEKDETFSSAGVTRILRDGSGAFYRYHHLDSYEPSVGEGDAVRAGQVIGYMGATGNTSWSHLHFEIWLNSLTPRDATIIDPVPLLWLPRDVTLRASTACSG